MESDFRQPSNDQAPATAAEYQPQSCQEFQLPSNPCIRYLEEMNRLQEQHGLAAAIPFRMQIPDPACGAEEGHMLPATAGASNQQDFTYEALQRELAGHFPMAHQARVSSSENEVHVPIGTGLYYDIGPSESQYSTYHLDLGPTYSLSGNPDLMTQTHHHHRLPNRSLQSTQLWPDYDNGVNDDGKRDVPSVVGQPGMPEPASKPRGPKLKFSPEDDVLLIKLKETENLTWKQIADFFPGRSSGTLQVRYCTKLKAKTIVWTEDTLDRLQQAVGEFECDRWRIVSAKLGNRFSADACKDKFSELNSSAM